MLSILFDDHFSNIFVPTSLYSVRLSLSAFRYTQLFLPCCCPLMTFFFLRKMSLWSCLMSINLYRFLRDHGFALLDFPEILNCLEFCRFYYLLSTTSMFCGIFSTYTIARWQNVQDQFALAIISLFVETLPSRLQIRMFTVQSFTKTKYHMCWG